VSKKPSIFNSKIKGFKKPTFAKSVQERNYNKNLTQQKSFGQKVGPSAKNINFNE